MSVRTTISLPDDLKARMDTVEEVVNWSSEAAKCFERLLGEIAARKQKKDLSDVIARLKASKIESDSEDFRLGHDTGKSWAENIASYAELERAAGYELTGGQWCAPWSGAYWVAFEILGVDVDNDADIEARGERFWMDALGTENRSKIEDILDRGGDTFLDGFIAGAGAVWEAVSTKL